MHSKFVVRAKFGIACGGLHSDKLAEMADGLLQPIIIPFRGEYLELKEEKRDLVRGNIYPVMIVLQLTGAVVYFSYCTN